MSSSIYRFTLDMQRDQSQVSLPVRLGDTDRSLYISLTNGGKPYTIEDGCLALLVGLKADGKDLANYCPIETNSVIRYDFTEQTANHPGIVECELRLFDKDGKLITSPRFIMVVDSRVVNENVTVSESEHNIINQISKAEQERASAETTRQANESTRTANEATRQSDEATRQSNDSLRTSNESQRVSAEGVRNSNEDVRISAEEKRFTSEENRSRAESERVSNETTRIANETSRKSAEEDRVVRANRADAQINSFMRYFTGTNYSVKTADDIVNLVINNEYQEGDIFVCESGDVTFMRYTKVNPGNIIGIDINSTEWLLGLIHIEPNKNYAIFYGNWGGYIITSDGYVPEDNILKTIEDRCANAIKAKASGEVIRVDDVSSNVHTVKCKVKSDDVNFDPTTVTVTRCGKNLFTTAGRTVKDLGAYSNTTKRSIGENQVYQGLAVNNLYDDAYVTSSDLSDPRKIKFTTSNNGGYGIGFSFKVKVGDTYTLSVGNRPVEDSRIALLFYKADGTNDTFAITAVGASDMSITATVPEGASWMLAMLLSMKSNTEIVFDDVQVELGTTATNYEPFTKTIHKPNSDGTVIGIKSLTPTMTVLTDTEGANLEIEYNQDSNKALANVNTDIKELDRVQTEHTALLGDVETALDTIISMQNSLIGGVAE